MEVRIVDCLGKKKGNIWASSRLDRNLEKLFEFAGDFLSNLSVMVDDYSFNLSIYVSRRNNISLLVKKQHVEIRISPYHSLLGIKKFLLQKEEWLTKYLRADALELESFRANFIASKRVLYSGSPTTVELVSSTFDEVIHRHGCLTVHSRSLSPEYCSVLLSSWLKSKTKERSMEILTRVSEQMGVKFGKISVRDQKTRFASCSSQGNLSFNFRCAMMPTSVFEYIVIHEASHLRYFNHSDKFWRLVANYCPEYKACEAWLKSNSYALFHTFDYCFESRFVQNSDDSENS